ncbi:DsbA family oxidoreductase [Shewanella sp. WXL01]|uniref:DsbA family protein n=1 Tax=Shewanella sp. WXL01 TaxID=2709721 RepID=UPI0014382578|nr:DsbA family oxidoreductase [Shewanella sp. WXL01]
MTQKIKLDIISDVVCPWCIVGYNHLNAAIEQLGMQDKVEIEWHPFELNPDMPPEGEELRAHVARKYGASREDSDRARANIAAAGAKYGFEFNYSDDMKMVNTFDAHVLLDYAKQLGKQTDLKMRLFAAFFTEAKDVSDRSVLIEQAAAVGIDAEQARNALNDEQLQQAVRQQESHWQQLGISSVPTVVFNRTSALNGAHPQETFAQVLQELAKS